MQRGRVQRRRGRGLRGETGQSGCGVRYEPGASPAVTLPGKVKMAPGQTPWGWRAELGLEFRPAKVAALGVYSSAAA